jgi:hypothetical protein
MATRIVCLSFNPSFPVQIEYLSNMTPSRCQEFLRQYVTQSDPVTGEVKERFFLIREVCDISFIAQPGSALMTLSEWLESKSIALDAADMARLSRLASKAYRELYGYKPRTLRRLSPNGVWNSKAQGYDPVGDAVLLESCLKQLRRSQAMRG